MTRTGSANRGEHVMRIVRWSGVPAVLRVKTRRDVTVVIPVGIPRKDVLGLASLILSNREYQQLWHAITRAAPPASPNGAAFALKAGTVGERREPRVQADGSRLNRRLPRPGRG